MWSVVNGIISLIKSNGENYYPHLSELQAQKDSPFFNLDGELYQPISDLPFRISNIGISQTIVSTRNDGKMSIVISVVKRGTTYDVIYNDQINEFLDYIIINDICYPIYGCLQTLNEVVFKSKVNPQAINFAQYMEIMRSLNMEGMHIADDAINRDVELLRSTEVQECETNGLKAELFPYQKSGLNWLSFMQENGCGCILGDEMGLGKTLQVIATLGHLKEAIGKVSSLVVCPVSLLENWRREIAKFYPSLTVLVNHGQNRTRYYDDLLQYDVVIIAYSSLQTDSAMLQMINWDVIVTDEAQNIKNPRALRTQYLKRLKKKFAIAVSGTPFENHMTDVWSLVDFVLPNYLGKITEFERRYGDNLESAEELE